MVSISKLNTLKIVTKNGHSVGKTAFMSNMSKLWFKRMLLNHKL